MGRAAKILLFLVLVMAAISSAFSQIPLTSKDLDQFSWRSIGPWSFSGRITNVAVPPGTSQTYYALTATGGVWKTVDGGIHFEPIFDKNGTMTMGYMAIAPSNPDILYVGTGESFHARSAYHGNGVWKSTDAGKTWTHVGLEQSFFIPKMAVDPRNPDVVYVAAEGVLYGGKPGGQYGLFKTTDGGKTWNSILDLKDRVVVDFDLDPMNPDTLIASGYKIFRTAWTFIDRNKGNLLYKTTDGGKSWKLLTAGLPSDIETGRNGVTIYGKNPKIVYVRLDEQVNLGLSERHGQADFRQGNEFRPAAVFRDGFYFNKFKSYRIDPDIARLIKFAPVRADSEKDLVKKLNDLIADRDFLKTIGLADWAAFNAAARKVYKGDKDIRTSIDEAEKTIKGEAAYRESMKKLNGFVLLALLADSPGVETTGAVKVIAADKARLSPAFKDLLTFDPKTIKDEKTFLAQLDVWAADPDVLGRLKVDPSKVLSKAKEVYKDNRGLLERLKPADDLAKEYPDHAGRTETLNRYTLEILYGGALAINAPVKKAGVIYRSEDGGETWKRMTEYKVSGGSDQVNQVEAGYYGRLVIDPNNDQVLYCDETQITISRDGGKTFKFTNWESNHKAHVDSRAIWVDPLNSKHILDCNDGGLDESWDGGQHWSQKETISAQQFYDISVDNEQPYNVMGGTQDNGCWLGPSQNRNANGVYPADWTYLPSGDGFYVVRNWWDSNFLYWESQFGGSNGADLRTRQTFSLAPRNTDEENAAGRPAQRYQWDSPIVLSPHNPAIVYVCSQAVHRSLSRGEKDTWETISPDLSKNIKERIDLSKKTMLQYGTIYAFAESPKKPGVFWAGTDDGNLQMSPDFGHSWVNITAKFYDDKGQPRKEAKGDRIPYDRWVTKALPSRFDDKTCYVAFSGYRTHNEDNTYLFVTHDSGATWEDIGRKMMNPVNDLAEDPDSADVLYLATDNGLFVTLDKARTWLPISTSVPNVVIKSLAVQARERELAVGTYGRGIYIVDIFPFKFIKDETFTKPAVLFDIKDAIQWNRNERRGQTLGEFAQAANPPVGCTFYYYLRDKADKVLVTIRDLSGQFVQEVNGASDAGLQKVFWGLNKKVDEDQLREMRREERMRQGQVEPGQYKATLSVNGKDVETKVLRVLPDPAFPAGR
jgi:photosystem II stability/assembly factor-like uncharacterized protein